MITLVKVIDAELPIVADLAKKIWNIHYPPIVGQEQVNYMLNKFYVQASLQQQSAEGQHFYFIKEDILNIGFISVSKKENGTVFIHKFYIDTTLHGRGKGYQVFELIKTMFQKNKPLIFNLTVNRQNYTAINFYFKIGFKIKEIANFDIGNNYFMNDFVMEYRL